MFGKALKQVAAEVQAATGLKTVIDRADVTSQCVLLGLEDGVEVPTLDQQQTRLTVSVYLLTADQKTSVVMDELGEMLKAYRRYPAAPAAWEFMAVTLDNGEQPRQALKTTFEILVTE